MLPTLKKVDHVHVFVTDRLTAERWYASVLGFRRIVELEFWSKGGGPLTIANPSGSIHLALFEQPAQKCRSTIAFGATAKAFVAWRDHLQESLGKTVEVQDHKLAWSLYFSDPDGNPFEITCYDYASLASLLRKTPG